MIELISEAQVLKKLNEAPGVKITRSTFKQSIRRVMASPARKEATLIGEGRRATWVYDPKDLWQWIEYLAVRAELIRQKTWSSKRPYSVRDLEDIALLGMHDDIASKLFKDKPQQDTNHED